MTVGLFFLEHHRYFDGKLLARGFDIFEAMEILNAERCWNILDSVMIDYLLEDATSQEGLSELRARVDKAYGSMYGSSGSTDNPNADYDYENDPDYEGVVIPGNYHSGPMPGEMVL